MWQLFIGSVVLSVIHALIPSHWLPIIAISRSEKWTVRESVVSTLITGFAHTLSTIIIGIIVGFIGIKIAEHYNYIWQIVAPAVLIAIGLFFLIRETFSRHHHHHSLEEKIKSRKTKTAILTSLSIAMFFSPCIEIEAFYLQSAVFGWKGIFLISTVYLFFTLVLMSLLVYLGLIGINKLNAGFLEHHEKKISGLVLIILGIVTFIVNHG